MVNVPSLRGIEPRKSGLGGWRDHVPFGYDLMAEFRPRMFVELGTFSGESYFAFCQSALENNTGTSCYAVDTWEGDLHTGPLAASAYTDVTAHNEQFYKEFSYLIRGTFDEALGQFTDGVIDLLHIDGLHTYEAVKHDFESWLPKVSPGGIILFHDIAARHDDFGVWKLWEEISEPGRSFSFLHGWGLGVWRKSTQEPLRSEFLRTLFESDQKQVDAIRRYYTLAARDLRLRKLLPPAEEIVPVVAPPEPEPPKEEEGPVRLQVFFSKDGVFSEQASLHKQIAANRWVKVEIPLPEDYAGESLRIDPASSEGLIDVAGVKLISRIAGESFWVYRTRKQLGQLRVEGTVRALPHDRYLRLFSYGDDPRIFVPDFEIPSEGEPLQLEIWLRVKTQYAPQALGWVDDALAHADKTREFASLRTELDASLLETESLRAQFDSIREKLSSTREELGSTREELSLAKERFEQDAAAWQTRLEETGRELESARLDLEAAGRDGDWARGELQDHRVRLEACRRELGAVRTERLLLATELNCHKEEVASLRDNLGQRSEQLAAERAGRIQALERLNDLDANIANRDADITGLNTDLAALHKELDTVKKHLDKAEDQYRLELGRRRSMQQSSSWKLTLPLRALWRLLTTGAFSPKKKLPAKEAFQ